MPERFEMYIVYKWRCINTLPFLSFPYYYYFTLLLHGALSLTVSMHHVFRCCVQLLVH